MVCYNWSMTEAHDAVNSFPANCGVFVGKATKEQLLVASMIRQKLRDISIS
jgi:hypothetical protein